MTEIHQFVPTEEALPRASIDEPRKIETIRTTAPDKKEHDHRVLKHFNNTIENRRYQVK